MRPGKDLRRHFPIFAAAEPPFHFLDNAATGQICRPAADALMRFETEARANVKRGVYRLADQATAAFDAARATMARYIGETEKSNVVFTSGATMALNIAANGLAARLAPGDEILLTTLEHHSNIVPWQLAAERTGAVVKALPVTDAGRLDLDRPGPLRHAAHPGDRRDACLQRHRCHDRSRRACALPPTASVPSWSSTAPSAPRTDRSTSPASAATSTPSPPTRCSAPPVPACSGARRSCSTAFQPLLGGGEMIREVTFERTTYAAPPHRFEAGTPPIGPVLAMAAAAEWLATLDWQAVLAHELNLTSRLLDGLQELPGIRVIGPTGLQQRMGVVSFEVDGVHAHDVCQLTDQLAGVALRGGHHCCQPLMARFATDATARASLAPYNDTDDIDALLQGLEQTIAMLR